MNRRYLIILCIVILSSLLIGCNHKTSITPGNSGQQTRTSPHIGDQAKYTNVMDIQGGQQLNVTGNGNRTYTIVAANNNRRTVPSNIINTFDLREDITQRIGNRNKTHIVMTWIGEDITGNLYRLGESVDGSTWDIVKDTNPPLYMPSKIKVGYWWKSVANFESGNIESITYRCYGIESLSTPLGTLKAYKLSRDVTDTRFKTSLTGFVWIPLTLPIVFELKESNDVTNPLANGNLNYKLESIELAE